MQRQPLPLPTSTSTSTSGSAANKDARTGTDSGDGDSVDVCVPRAVLIPVTTYKGQLRDCSQTGGGGGRGGRGGYIKRESKNSEGNRFIGNSVL